MKTERRERGATGARKVKGLGYSDNSQKQTSYQSNTHITDVCVCGGLNVDGTLVE